MDDKEAPCRPSIRSPLSPQTSRAYESSNFEYHEMRPLMPILESSSETMLSSPSIDKPQTVAHTAETSSNTLLSRDSATSVRKTGDVEGVFTDVADSRGKKALRNARRKVIAMGQIVKILNTIQTEDGAGSNGDVVGLKPFSPPDRTPVEEQRNARSGTNGGNRIDSALNCPHETVFGKRQSAVGVMLEASLKPLGPSPSSPSLPPAPLSTPSPATSSTFARLAQLAVAASSSNSQPELPSGGLSRNPGAVFSPGTGAAAARRRSSIVGASSHRPGLGDHHAVLPGNGTGVIPPHGSSSAPVRRMSTNAGGARRPSLITPVVPPSKRSSAVKQKFTVTEEVLRQIKSQNRSGSQNLRVWSPRALSDAKSSLTETESLVNSYVELVCEDLRTSEKRKFLAEEQERATWIIDPGAQWRIRWDVMMLIFVIWTSYSVPYRASFSTDNGATDIWLELCIDILFCLDVILNFFTAYYETEGILQTNSGAIARRYLRGWFIVDVVSSIPVSGFSASLSPSLARLFLALKFVKLVRLVRLMRYMDSKEVAMFFTPSMLRLFTTFVLLTWIWHVITCMYWFISTSQGLGSTEWTPSFDHHYNTDLLNYFLCFGWTVQTTFSISPYNPPEKMVEAIFTISCYLIGIFLNAYVIGSAGSALQSMDHDKIEQRQLMDRIITYMKKRRLPAYFQRIILDFYNYMSAKHSEEGILTDLPPAIQLRLSLLLNRELVKNIPLLKQLELNTIIGLMQTLQSTMYMPGEHVFKEGDKGEFLYFVKNGQLEITLDNVTVIR